MAISKSIPLKLTLLLFIAVSSFLTLPSVEAQNSNYSSEVSDPLEDFNRAIFWFNDTVDVFFLEPIARGYDFVMPRLIKDGVGNFFENLSYPVLLTSDLLQGKTKQAQLHTSRFLINTTMGIGGFFDLAEGLGLREHPEDIGTALAFHGVGDGPYLVLPFLGPTNLRDFAGTFADRALTPTPYLVNSFDWESSVEDKVNVGTTALEVVNLRARLLDAVDSAKEASLDYYLFVRSAYKQRRDSVIYDGLPPEPAYDDEFEEEYEEEIEDEFDDSKPYVEPLTD